MRLIKNAGIAVSALMMIFSTRLPAQTVSVPFTFSGTSPVVFQMDSYGNLSSLGTYGTGTFSLTGAGTRMFWYPGKAAFRAGYVSSTQWNDANIGAYSIALGENPTASGSDSIALNASTATGPGSFSSNTATASGSYSFATGEYNVASGEASAAFGEASYASGIYSAAFNIHSTASGYGSAAFGYAGAFGTFSDAFQDGSAQGVYTTCFGYQSVATAYESVVLGQYNVGGGNSSTWVAADPLFEIGNGTGSSATSDALVVYKNGNTTVQGMLASHTGMRCPQQGDLSMGSFTAGTTP